MKSTLNLKHGLLSLAAAGLFLTMSASAKANSGVYQQTVRSTTWVISKLNDKQNSNGAGALVDEQRRLVVTNYHVVEKRPEVTVFFPSYEDGDPIALSQHYLKNAATLGIKGKVLVSDSTRDLAVIQLERLPEGLKAIPMARRSASPGQMVHGIGNSDSAGGTLWRYTNGPVRGVFRKRITSGNSYVKPFVVDARVVESQMPTNPGDSGGPVVNDRGELIGITQGTINGQQLVAIAIDISEVRAALEIASKPAPKEALDGDEIAASPVEEVRANKPAPAPVRKSPAPQPVAKRDAAAEEEIVATPVEEAELRKPAPQPQRQAANRDAAKNAEEVPAAPIEVAEERRPAPRPDRNGVTRAPRVADVAKDAEEVPATPIEVAEERKPAPKPLVTPPVKQMKFAPVKKAPAWQPGCHTVPPTSTARSSCR